MFIRSRSTRNKEKGSTQQHSIAMAVATATSAATASTRISVDGKEGGGRPCLDSRLVRHPRNLSIFTTFITTTTSVAAAAIATNAATPVTLVIAEIGSTPFGPVPTLKVTTPTPTEPVPPPIESAPTPTEPATTPTKQVLVSTEPIPSPTEPAPTPTTKTISTAIEAVPSTPIIPETVAIETAEHASKEPEAKGEGQQLSYDLELAHDSFRNTTFTTATATSTTTIKPAITVTTTLTTAIEAPTTTTPTATTLTATAPVIEAHISAIPTTATPTTIITTKLGPKGPEPPLGKDQFKKIPVDILQNIALFLTPQDFTSLSLASKRTRLILDEHWVWHQRFLLHLGKGLLVSLLNPRNPDTNELLHVGEADEGKEKDTTTVSKAKLRGWYRTYSRTAVPPRGMGISHSNNGYWKFIKDSRGPYGQVVKMVSGLWWLDVRTTLYGLSPGRYWVQWGVCLLNSSSVVGTQFRVAAFPRNEVPSWDNNAENSIDYTPNTFHTFLHHTNATNKDVVSPEDPLVFQLPQVLVVEEDKPTVFVQMKGRDRARNGLTILFVRVIPAGDDEQDVKEDPEEDEEGLEDALVEGEDVNQWMDEDEDQGVEGVGGSDYPWDNHYGESDEDENQYGAGEGWFGGANGGEDGQHYGAVPFEGGIGPFEGEIGPFDSPGGLFNYASGIGLLKYGHVGGGSGHAGGPSSASISNYNDGEEEDIDNARPWAIRMAGRNH